MLAVNQRQMQLLYEVSFAPSIARHCSCLNGVQFPVEDGNARGFCSKIRVLIRRFFPEQREHNPEKPVNCFRIARAAVSLPLRSMLTKSLYPLSLRIVELYYRIP